MSGRFVDAEHEGGTVVITINRPPVNALNGQLIKELIDTFDELEKDPKVSVVILTGAGKAFIAGADINEIPALNEESGKVFSAMSASRSIRVRCWASPVWWAHGEPMSDWLFSASSRPHRGGSRLKARS